MVIKSIIQSREDFTGEFPITENTGAMWRFNETAIPENLILADSSENARALTLVNRAGTTVNLTDGRYGRYYRQNLNNPTEEKTHLFAENDGTLFSNLGSKIVVGGWFQPTTYTIGQTYISITNTRQGSGSPLFDIGVYRGQPSILLYNSSGTAILDVTETPSFSLMNGTWFFIGIVVDVVGKTMQSILGNRSSGVFWSSPLHTFTGTINQNCLADIYIGKHSTNYYSGGLDDWFFETDSQLTVDDLKGYFQNALMANGSDTSNNVFFDDGLVLKNGEISGTCVTIPTNCALSGSGRIAVTSEYIPGVTEIALVETSTSDDYINWSDWQAVGGGGELISPNAQYIRYRVTLTTNDTSKSPKLIKIALNDIPKPPYNRYGFARPVVLDKNGGWEAVLENAYDIIATGEINGADTLTFSIPYNDSKRQYLQNEKQIQIAENIYRIRTLTDEKGSDNKLILTTVYAEAAFYDLTFSQDKAEKDFNAATADETMRFALQGTDWSIGTVNVSTKRTWQCTEKNSLAILRMIQKIHGGDLIFDNVAKTVSLFAMSGKDSGALFSYKKNLNSIKRVVDTRSLVTRLYAYGKDGLTFASINSGKPYLEDFTYTNEVRVSTLDLSSFSNPYQMLEYTNMRLAEYAKARISYVLSAMDLSVLTGYEHESWGLGDIITVHDSDFNITLKTRVIRLEYNLQEPWKTRIELSTKLRELGDSISGTIADQMESSGLSSQVMKDMVPYNHLRNSRADSDFAYWANSGFEIDNENGVSGSASFKAVGALGITKSMEQTVFPANRKSYTVSAEIASENLSKGPNGRIGIEIAFEYADGSTETRFVELF